MSPVSRRSFLALASGGAALGSIASLRAAPAAALTTGGGVRFFADAEREILTQVVERMVDTGEPEAPAVRATRTIDTIDALCAGLDPVATAPLPALLRVVEWSPLLFERRLARFTSLDAAGQDAALHGWMTSRLTLRRVGFYALRNLALLGYWSQDETWPLVGYAGPLLRKPRSVT
jgi:hypothetical protein